MQKFIEMVGKYKSQGYRMVEFETPDTEKYGSSSWICAFNTNGENADNIPIERFANKIWLKDLREYAMWNGPVKDVKHIDVTDDMDEMIGGYDYKGEFPVLELID